jgi:hypothetical protein
MTVDELIAREEIRSLLAHYNSCGDRGAVEEMVQAFAEDAVLDIAAGTFEGRGAILSFMQGVRGRGALTGASGGAAPRPVRHHLTTSRVDLEGPDAARAWTYFLVVRDGVVLQNGVYVDRFARAGGRWAIAHRRIKMEYDLVRASEAASP